MLAWTLRDKLRKAREAYAQQSEDFEDLTNSLEQERIAMWTATVTAWEADPFNRDDPYVAVSQGTYSHFCSAEALSEVSYALLGPTQAETLRTLSEEEQRASAVPGYIALHDVTVVGFVSMGLELEETKYVSSVTLF